MEDQIKKIKGDILEIRIQGATNVAKEILKFLVVLEENGLSKEEVIKIGRELSLLRDNEPLARNGIKFLESEGTVKTLSEKYLEQISESQSSIARFGAKLLTDHKVILTHCHSSTVIAILKELFKKKGSLTVITTETRPKYQGRITAKELSDEGIEVISIVDSLSSSFIDSNQWGIKVDAVIVGTDELLEDGSNINKLGSKTHAIVAGRNSIPYYVATPLLKFAPGKNLSNYKIEMRSETEVWEEKPANVRIINPAFDCTPSDLVTDFITDKGIFKSSELKDEVRKDYSWILS